MVNIQRVPGKGELQKYLRQGLTQAKIVEKWEEDSGHRVSRSAIAMAISRYGLKSAHESPRYPELLPWELAKEHWGASEARLLRHEARRRAGGKLRDIDEHWVNSWLEALAEPSEKAPQGNVVGYSKEKGFYWTPRRPWHDDIIERPEDEAQSRAE